jgi:hypothetical protein
MTFHIDPETRDLVFGPDGDITLSYGLDTVAQCVRVTLQVYKGEFPLDPGHGTDYARIMGAKGVSDAEKIAVLREGVYQEACIRSVKRLDVSSAGRGVAASLAAETADGGAVSLAGVWA